ncbi:hypothetical protein ACMU_06545 [Actibacterium mucosum KCTC 23349]|uniref:Sel1 repeat family protein n=1 Tax=Actibacterium mucosum KCTC 23349 TaxID=1454373 RepID=A0A037ZKG3_9RHOB|nr:hypothetical protein [Actibacterium mucosum]KAJ56598.1 hypothetical protein ACMU_06545 [Actibacterium mucosum KCTC 23349]
MRHTASILAAATISLGAVPSQADSWGEWLDLITPEQLMQRMLQTGIMAARTQLDIQYGDMVVSPLSGTVSISDVAMWPLPDWDDNGDCFIGLDKLALRTAPPQDPSQIRLKVQASGLSVHGACLPPDARQPLQMAGLTEVFVPRATIDMDYDIASAGAFVHVFAEIDDVAAVSASGDFTYVWFDGRDDMDNPDPVVFMSSATLSLENLGIWEQLKAFAPEPLTNPETASGMVNGMLSQAMMGINADAAPEGGQPEPISEAQAAFVNSTVEAWQGFLANPNRLVLETGYDSDSDIYVDFIGYEDDPLLMFEDLQPRVALAPAAARGALPVALLQAALNDAASLSADDALTVGEALVSGNGVPRNMAAGTAILEGLARNGDPDAAVILAEAMEDRAPEQAYFWALLAGSGGVASAQAQLDRLELELPVERILALQADAEANAQLPVSALANVNLIRMQAAERLSGLGQTRSYGTAAVWAMLAAAAGDPEGADILAEIDARMSGASGDPSAWAAREAEASALATEAWIGRNLADALSK